MKTTFTLILILCTSTLHAVKFHSYINDKGETVFSNVPQNCIKNSTLTCLKYHPVFSSGTNSTVEPGSDSSQPVPKAKNPINARSNNSNSNAQSRKSGTGLQLDILDRVVEMNKVINEYFPGQPDPLEANQVRQQQDDILDILQVIRNTASGEEQSSIEKAIDVLRSNLVQ